MRTINCREAERLMQGELDGSCDHVGMPELLNHAESCRPCRERREEYRDLRHQLRGTPEDQVATDTWERVAEAAGRRMARPRHPKAWRATAGMAAIVTVAVIAVALLTGAPGKPAEVLAASLKAMKGVTSVHAKGEHSIPTVTRDSSGFRMVPYEAWYVDGVGLREETPFSTRLTLPDKTYRLNRPYSAAIIYETRDEGRFSWFGGKLQPEHLIALFRDHGQPPRVEEADAELDGAPVRLITVHLTSESYKFWIDPDSMLTLRFEIAPVGLQETVWTEYEYDVDLPPDTMTWAPADGVKVTDLSAVPLREAYEQYLMGPSHWVTLRSRVQPTTSDDLRYASLTEAWEQAGTGLRAESKRTTQVYHDNTGWFLDHTGERSQPMAEVPGGFAKAVLTTVDMARCHEARLTESTLDGEPVLVLELAAGCAKPPTESEREERSVRVEVAATFSLDTKRLIRARRASWIDGEPLSWESAVIDYPDSLPDDVFSFTRDWSRPTPPIEDWDEERKRYYTDLLFEE